MAPPKKRNKWSKTRDPEIIEERREHVSETLAKKKKKMGLSKAQLEQREKFIKKLAEKRKMWGLGAPGGDMIGGPYEYTDNNIFHTNFELFGMYSVTTDDGKLALTLGEFLAKNDPLKMSKQEATKKLMDMYFATCRENLDVNGGWGTDFRNEAEDAERHPREVPNFSSWANGGAMRVGAVISAARTLDEAILLAEISALPSHSNPQGLQGATAVAVVGWMAKNGYKKDEILAYCKKTFKDFNWDRPLSSYREYYRNLQDDGKATCPCKAVDTVPIAIRAFLECESESYADVVKLAISAGGDSDTIGAMAGAIAEAAYDIPEDIKVHIMDGLDNVELTRAIDFDAFAARRQMEIEWDKKYKDRLTCGQKPREVYEEILQEMLAGEELKNALGEDLPESLRRVIDAVNDPTGHIIDAENLSALSAEAADALEKLHQTLTEKMIKEYDADAIDKVEAINKLLAVTKGMSLAPVMPAPEMEEKTHRALGERADELSREMYAMRMAARIPPEGARGDKYVVIEPNTKEYKVMKRAEEAMRNIQKAVGEDAVKPEEDPHALRDLKNGDDFAALLLYEEVQHHKTIAALDPNAPENADRVEEIKSSKQFLQDLESKDVDKWLADMKNAQELKDVVAGLDVAKINNLVEKQEELYQEYSTLYAKNEEIFAKIEMNSKARDVLEAKQMQDTERKLDRLTAFGERTARYYKGALKDMSDELKQLFAENPESEVIEVTENGMTKRYDLRKLLQTADSDLNAVQNAKTEGNRYLTGTDAMETLELISKCLQEKMMDSANDDDLKLQRQISLVNRMMGTLEEFREAPDDPRISIEDGLYHNLSDRINAIDDRMEELSSDMANANMYELANRARTGMQNMQQAVAQDFERGKGDDKALNALKKGDDYAAVFLYQQMENFKAVSERQPEPNDSPATKAQITAMAKGAQMILDGFQNQSLEAMLKQVKNDKTFKEYEANLNVFRLDKAMKSPGAMLQEYNNLQQPAVQPNVAPHTNARAARGLEGAQSERLPGKV